MIDKEANPVAWALLQYELSDAQEHLGQLLREMQEQPDFGEAEYHVWLAHIYVHFNRAWNRRDVTDAQLEAEDQQADTLGGQAAWDGQSSFPLATELF